MIPFITIYDKIILTKHVVIIEAFTDVGLMLTLSNGEKFVYETKLSAEEFAGKI